MFRRSKKFSNIGIEDGHLFLEDVKGDLRLLMLRPIDLIEFIEFAGTNAEETIIWVGKTIGKYICNNIYPDEDWSGESLSKKKEIINNIIEELMKLGFGNISTKFKKDNILIIVKDPLPLEERENIMAKNLCILTNGIFEGIIETLEIDATGEEIHCVLLDDEACVFQYDLLLEEFDEEDIDSEEEESEISDFLTAL
ncbi:MAG: methanogen output domain 1-containing protein [Promethearchaeia archaeon]